MKFADRVKQYQKTKRSNHTVYTKQQVRLLIRYLQKEVTNDELHRMYPKVFKNRGSAGGMASAAMRQAIEKGWVTIKMKE